MLNSANITKLPLYETAKYVGSVFQNPRTQFFTVDSTSELAFGCENQGIPEKEIVDRILSTSEQFDLNGLLGKNIFSMSGGEKQKIACVSVSISNPPIMVLDEPSSNLDMSSTEDLRCMIQFWKQQGKTVVIAEHRIYYLHDLIDRVLYLKDGKIQKDYQAAEALALSAKQQMDTKQYDTLHINSLVLPHEVVAAVVGHNGEGKSTFARCLCGLEKHCKDIVKINRKRYDKKKRLSTCYMVMQDVNHQLFTESNEEEMLISMAEPDSGKAERMLERLNLLPFKDRHPMTLSDGQKQRI